MISKIYFAVKKKLLTLMRAWMNGKSLIKQHYSNVNMEDITDADYMHAKRVCKGFEIKYLGEYHDLICI